MRCGLFLTVFTPSGDSVDSMMYAGMSAFRRVPRVLPHLVVGWVALTVPTGAAAATVQTNLACYLEDRQVQLAGTGYTPGAAYTVLRDGQAIGSGMVAADGSVTGSFTSGVCGSITRTRMRRLFPFRPTAGRWRLQFDTRRTYRRSAVPRIVRAVDVRRDRKR